MSQWWRQPQSSDGDNRKKADVRFRARVGQRRNVIVDDTSYGKLDDRRSGRCEIRGINCGTDLVPPCKLLPRLEMYEAQFNVFAQRSFYV